MKMNKRSKRKLSRLLFLLALVLVLSLASRFLLPEEGGLPAEPAVSQSRPVPSGEEETIPEYAGEPYYVLNGNQPFFTEEELFPRKRKSFSI